MRFFRIVGCIIVGLTLLAAACATASAPVPAPPPVAPATPQASATPVASVSTQDAAWASVVKAAQKEGKVDVYSYNMIGDVGTAVAKAFKDKYGIDVDIITGMGASLTERALTEQRMKSVVADIVDSNSFQTGNIKDAVATVSSADLPILQQTGVWRVDPWASDPDKHIIVHTIVYMTSFINTDVVKPADEPKSFLELTQPKWRGKVVDIDPRITSGAANFFATLFQRKLIDENTVRAIGTNGANYTALDQEARTSVIQGRYSLLLMVSPGSFATNMKDGVALPIKPVAWQEGTLVTNRAMTAIKGSPHPNAAKLFMNWLLTPEGQTIFLKAVGLPPVRSDVPDFTPAAMRFTPVKAIAPTLAEERQNLQMFRDGWLAKLWGR